MYYSDGEEIMTCSFCTVSDNLAHQAYGIWAHLDPIINIMSTEFPQTESVHFFSDSPSSQYQNRINHSKQDVLNTQGNRCRHNRTSY